ncbi:HEAT repeat domain-containing protein [Streptomyces erythrochromogenes]|uniref:HEAT repeat domain-containing protein n=1 Tax=Streptomyces erythrochromogenes TaxID=285574 RepID=UPI00343FEC44
MTGSTYLGRPETYWVELLSSPDLLERRLGAYALGEIGSCTEGTAAQLHAVMRSDPSSFVRVWAAGSLMKTGHHHVGALQGLLAACGDDLAFVRSLAVWMLGRLELGDADTASALIAVQDRLEDDDRSVREEAGIAERRMERSLQVVDH